MSSLDRSAVPLFVGVALALVAARYAGYGLAWTVAGALGAGLIALWLLVTLVWALIGRPADLAALAQWDEKAGRHELFTSAYSFVCEGAEGPGVELHLTKAEAELPKARAAMRRELPWYLSNPSWLAPTLFLVFLCSGLLEAPPAVANEKDALSAEELARAAEAGEQLEKRTGELDPEQLTAEEKAELNQLKKKLKSTAKKLKSPKKKTTQRQLLEELQRRARQAEKLANKMGKARREKISGGLLAELERHADTADLAGALRGNEFADAAKEAKALGDKLSSPDLGIEARQRIQEAFSKGVAAATQQDKLTRLGKGLVKANQALIAKKPADAGAELLKLAKFYAKLAKRLKAQKQLKQLAKRLRELGQETMGKKQKGAKRLQSQPPPGRNSEDEVRRLTTEHDFGDAELPPLEEPLPPGAEDRDPLQDLIPLDEPPGAPGQRPVPGEGPPPMPGQQPGGRAPVPGQGGGQGRRGGKRPVPGGGAGQGGHQAGNGSAGMGGEATKTLDPTSTEVVKGRKGRGPSAVRRRAGRGHREGAAEGQKAIETEFIKAEEDALAGEPLPASRKRQILRYFRAIRQTLKAKSKTD
jgi:hypothetical protein